MRRLRAGDPVLKYYVYLATTYIGFIAPIWILYARGRGLSFAQIGVLDAVWWAGVVLGEVPTGYVADRIGRRNGMLAGSALMTVMMVGWGLAHSFAAFAVVYALGALGFTFISGSTDAWLYDLLAERDQTAAFSTVRGRANALALLVAAISAPLGGLLFDLEPSLPFFAGAVVAGFGVLVLLTVPESGSGIDEALAVGDVVPVIRTQLARPGLRAFVLYLALLFAALEMTFVYDQPIVRTVGLEAGVPEGQVGLLLGVMYAGFTAVSAGVSYHAGTIRDRIGIERWFAILPFVVGPLFVALWVVPVAAIPVFFLARAVTSSSSTLANQYLNDRVEEAGRATVLSAASMCYSLAIVPFAVAGGWLASATSPFATVAAAGGVLLVGAIGIWLWEAPFAVHKVASQSAD